MRSKSHSSRPREAIVSDARLGKTGAAVKSLPHLTTATVALTGLLVAGCASSSIQPEAKTIAFPPRVPEPIPIQVAIVQSTQNFSREAGDQAVELSRRLQQSGLFEAVHYPLLPTAQLGATMELRVDRTTYIPDWMGLIGAFVLKNRHQCLVDGKLVLLKGTEVIKTYSALGKAPFEINTTPKEELEVTQAAAWAMQARLIEQLIQDRDFLAQKLKASP